MAVNVAKPKKKRLTTIRNTDFQICKSGFSAQLTFGNETVLYDNENNRQSGTSKYATKLNTAPRF